MESWFKTTPDDRQVFYPWGNLNKQGYVITSRRDFRRLQTQINIWIGVSIASIIAAARWHLLIACAVCVVCSVFYFAWMRWLVRGLQPYDAPEPLS
jgi:hypothetical protein